MRQTHSSSWNLSTCLYDEDGNLYEGISEDGYSLNTTGLHNYVWTEAVVHQTTDKMAGHMFEVLHISSQTRNYTDPMEPVYHSEGGVLVSISYGLNNLSFVEINGTLYSKTDGIDGKLHDARIFIEVRPMHFAADIFRLIAHIYITFLTAHYIFSGSQRSYSHVCIYDIISGNRLIAISMFIATVVDFDLSLNIFSRLGWFVFWTGDLFNLYQ